jgi:lysophospholipase L1-like esterase
MPNIVLLGDSTLDNASYVPAGRHVSAMLQEQLPEGWRATLLAIDGDVIGGIARQLQRVPEDASHLIVSVGGNDALRESGLLSAGARSVADALERLSAVRERFAADYRAMLDTVEARRLPTAICTIYEAAFPDPASRRIAATALAVLNDVITREAASRGLPLIDLRVIFSDPADYANAIEPSAEGGRKLAAAITAVVTQHDFAGGRSNIFLARP